MKKIYMNNIFENHPDFIPWMCQYFTVKKIQSRDRKTRMQALRVSSSAFIARKDVREYIFGHKGTKCYICGAEADQIDHKTPVHVYAYEPIEDVSTLNSYENLFPICKHCNVTL